MVMLDGLLHNICIDPSLAEYFYDADDGTKIALFFEIF